MIGKLRSEHRLSRKTARSKQSQILNADKDYSGPKLGHSCLQTPCCPLRLNESTTTTAGRASWKHYKSKSQQHDDMRLVQSISHNDARIGMMPQQLMSGCNTMEPHKVDLVNNNKSNISRITYRKPRQDQGSQQHHPRRSYYLNISQWIQLTAIVVITNLISIECLSQSISLAAPPSTPSICPLVQSCLCKWVTNKMSASCDRRNLQTIPMQLPHDTQILDMSGNNLNQLQQHVFQERKLTNLQKLYLSDCKISYIADEAFIQLTNLIELDLSNNFLQQVPSKSLEPLKYSLRKLVLAKNSIHVLESGSFNMLNRLNLLDLSNNQLMVMKSAPFSGLNELKELKLNENSLSQLPSSAIADLREYTTIDLYNNPWNCDCELRSSIELMQRRHIQQSFSPTCVQPARHKDIRWQNIKLDDFMCPPVIINKQNELVVGAGSNVTLECSARGSPPLTFVWFQDEKNLTGRHGGSMGSNGLGPQEPPPSTKLLEEKRYEIAEEVSPNNVTTSILYLMNLKLTDTSLFLCWVENANGYTLGNFTLTVNDSPPATFMPGSSSNIGASGSMVNDLGSSLMSLVGMDPSNSSTAGNITIIFVTLLLVLLLAVIGLMILRQMIGTRSTKKSSSSQSDLKVQHANSGNVLSSSYKYSNNIKLASGGRMFASSDDDEEEDDRSESDSANGSQSSCRKIDAGDSHNIHDFIKKTRTGIINMDYIMNPAVDFNSTLPSNKQQQLRHDVQQQQQLTQLNHFPSASNASSQQAAPLFYGMGAGRQTGSNGSNSMATTLSDLSPSSGSASTSFANGNNLVMHQFANSSNNPNAMFRPPNATTTNCDFQIDQHHLMGQLPQHHELAHATLNRDYNHQQHQHPHHPHHARMIEDPRNSLMGSGQLFSGQPPPPMYNYSLDPQLYNQTTLLVNGSGQMMHHPSSRPPSMNCNNPIVMQHQQHVSQQQQQQQDSPGSFQIL